jgi:DNA-binding response OmpR family regulator
MKRILAIDDDDRVLGTLKTCLEVGRQYTVITAHGGKAGLKAARRERPHLILLDMNMPDKDGLEVLAQLSEDPLTRYTPVIMLTAEESEDAKDLAPDQYAELYITKPFDMKELEERIRRILARRARSYAMSAAMRRRQGSLVLWLFQKWMMN